MNEEINIFSFGFDRNLNKKMPEDGESLEFIEDRIDKILQSGDTVTTTIPGLLESEYNGF